MQNINTIKLANLNMMCMCCCMQMNTAIFCRAEISYKKRLKYKL